MHAQTTLSMGDIAIVGINANAPDQFSFLSWVELTPNTVIKFSDNGFNSTNAATASGNYREQEQYVVWTNNTGSTIPAGTTILITVNPAGTATIASLGAVTVTNSSNGTAAVGMALVNNMGDQIFAFQGTGGQTPNSAASTFSGTLLFGIGYSGSTPAATTWVTTGTINGSTSYLPSSLSGTSQIFLVPNVVGAYYSAARTGLSVAEYKTAIANSANWTKVSAGTVTFPVSNADFYLAPAITVQPSNSTVCAQTSATFSVTASNALTYQWQVNLGSGFTHIPAVSSSYSGQLTSVLTITSASAVINGAAFRCIVTGAASSTATSQSATITVQPVPVVTATPASATVCTGTATNIALTSSPTGTSYSWSAAITSGTVTGSSAGSGPSIAQTLTGEGVVNYTITPTLNSCPGTPISVVVTVSVPGTWLGGSSDAWSNAANWSCGTLPTASTDVTISGSAPNMPTVDITNAVCNNITIPSEAWLTINPGMNLEVNGAFTNNGSFFNVGKITFSGANQVIPGGNYISLEIAGSGTKTFTGPVYVNGTLALTAGYIQLGNHDLIIGAYGNISGGSASSYVIIDGTGALKQQEIGAYGRTGNILFPVGTGASYTPISIANTGMPDEFGVKVIAGVSSDFNTSDVPTGTPDLINNVDRTWLLTEAIPGGSDVTLTFQWNAADEQDGFNRLACFVAHYYNDSWHAGSTGIAAGSNPYTRTLGNISSFSPFAIGSQNSILPLNLISFTGKSTAHGNQLEWVTTDEINTASFMIEKSTDGSNFIAIGTVGAKNTAGNQSYNYTDKNVQPGTVYYRLKMMDTNGGCSYSAIVRITSVTSNSNAPAYSIAPNPVVGNVVNILASYTMQQDVQLSILDAAGRVWKKEKITPDMWNSGKVSVNIGALSAGVYYVQIYNTTTKAFSVMKFKKNTM